MAGKKGRPRKKKAQKNASTPKHPKTKGSKNGRATIKTKKTYSPEIMDQAVSEFKIAAQTFDQHSPDFSIAMIKFSTKGETYNNYSSR